MRDEGKNQSREESKYLPNIRDGITHVYESSQQLASAQRVPYSSQQTACTHSPLLLYKYDHYVEVICLHFYVSTTVTTVYFYPIFYPMVTWPLLAIRLSLSRDLGL